MDAVDIIYRAFTKEWARIAVHEAASGHFRAAKLAETVARQYERMGSPCYSSEQWDAWEKEQAVNIAAYCNERATAAS